MKRDIAIRILHNHLHNPILLRHSLAVEAVMKDIYVHLAPKEEYEKIVEEKWGIAGLLHDADYEMAKGNPKKHGLLLFEMERTIPDDIVYAIKAHNHKYTKLMPKSKMDWALATCDQLTGFIYVCALNHPQKKLTALTPDYVLNKFHDKSFAKGADRHAIMECEHKLRIPLKQFIDLALKSMQFIHRELGF